MAAPTTIDEAITQAALGPSQVSIDGRGTVTAQDPLKLIQVKDHESKVSVAKSQRFGLVFGKVRPPPTA